MRVLFCLCLLLTVFFTSAHAGNVFPPDGPCTVGDNIIYSGDGFKCQRSSAIPAGTVAFFALAACPTGWAMANGANGTVDLRGHFLRAWDAGRGVDPGRGLGTMQGDAIRNITGTIYVHNFYIGDSSGVFALGPNSGYRARPGSNHYHDYNTSTSTFDASRMVPTAAENRPVNIALLACQKL